MRSGLRENVHFGRSNIEFSTRPASERHYPDLLRKRVYSSEFCLEYCNDLLGANAAKRRPQSCGTKGENSIYF